MIDHLIDGLISLIDTYIFYLFLRLFMQQRNHTKLVKLFCFVAIMFIHTISYHFVTMLSSIRFVIFIIIDIIFSFIIFKDKWNKYLLFTALYYILYIIIDSAALSILNFIVPNIDAFKTASGEYSLQTLIPVIIVRLIVFFIIYAIKTLKKQPIRHKQWKSLLLMPVTTLAFVWIIYPKYWSLHNKEIENLLMVLAVFLVLQNSFILAYITAVQSSTERYFEMKAAYDRQKQYYSTVKTIQNAIRKMAHDIRHHFVYLMSALEQEDIPKAKSYLIELDENLDNMVPLNVTGHYDVDALLHAKARLADGLGVHIRVDGVLPPEIMISPIDLSVLLGNSLDNAITATSQVNDQKEITISFVYNAPRLSFTISNPYVGKLQKKQNGYFISQKHNGGLGVEIMDQVVKKYNGALLADYSDDQFTLSAMLQAQCDDKREIQSIINQQ